MKKIIGPVQLVQKAVKLNTLHWNMEDKQQGRVDSNVDSSNLNGLRTGFSFQNHTISEK